MRLHLLGLVMVLCVVASSCAGATDPTVVDGVSITEAQVAALHSEFDELDENERSGSLLLLILREGFGRSAADDLDISPDASEVEVAYQERVEGFESRGGVDFVLESMNQTTQRVRIESELDVIRDSVAGELVRSESPGFDLESAYEAYLLIEAEVCIRQMQLAAGPDFDVALDRLTAGESFEDVARDISIDPFVDRDEGVGAGGELGCSAPSALPGGLAEATLTAQLNEPTGPVIADTGIYLLEVYERTAPELVDVRAEVIEFGVDQQGPNLFRLWAVEVLQNLDVEVGEAFGFWAMLPETDPVPTVVPPHRENDIIVSG